MMQHRWSRSLSRVVALALFAGVPAIASAQGTTVVTGKVTDKSSGTPIPGASIALDGSTITATSSDAGTFTLTVPAGRTGSANLTARRIGFRSLRVPVTLAGRPVTADFALTAQATELSEVVVTALNQQREKATLGTAQQTVNADQITAVQAPNLINAMSGQVAGLQISNSGNIGGSSRIVIRGPGSILGNNQPLFIVDGQPILNDGFSTASAGGGRDYGSAISDLNMDDVSSITVLKGPNAAALYGSRASNGAVVITTKNGRNMLKGTKFSFTSRVTADQMSVFPTYQNGYGQGFGGQFNYVDGAGSGTNDGADESWGPKLDGRTHGCVFTNGAATPAIGAPSPYDQTAGCDQFTGKAQPWIAHPNNVRDFFRTGTTISNNANVSASGDNSGARLSLTRDEVSGIVPNSSVKNMMGSLNASTTIRDRLTIGGNVAYTQTSGMNRPENGYAEDNPFMTFTWFGRQVDVDALKNQFYNLNSPYGFADGSLFNWNDNYHRNPWWQHADNPAPDTRDRMIAQANATYQFVPWLSGTIRAGTDGWRQTTVTDWAAGNIDHANPSYNGGFSNSTGRAKELNIEGLLTATHQFSHVDLTANFGGNQRRNDNYSEGFSTSGILVPGIYNLANSAIAASFSNSESHQAVNSSYGSLVATVNSVWTVEATGRNDWSSTLPKANASYFYPSVSSSLLLSDLFPAITRNGVLSYLKLRGGWARVGSDAGPYQLQTTFSGLTSKFNSLPQYTLGNSSANAFLKPEQTTGQEGGVELSLYDDRITLDATRYQKVTKDQILNLTTSPTSGFTSAAVNAGQMSNRGWEATLTAKVLRLSNGFQWTSTVNWLRNKNMVDKLATGLTQTTIASQWSAKILAKEGQPYGVLWGPGWLRDSASGKIITSGGLPVSTGSSIILGNVNPDWTGGWSNEFRYKNWGVSSLLDMRHGGKNFSIGNWWGMYAGILGSTLKGREVDWNNPGLLVDGIDQTSKTANTTRVTAEDYGHNLYPTAEPAVFNSGFVKLREVRVSYDVPSRYLTRMNISGLNLSLVGRNLGTWTSFPNYDPENATNAGNGGQGFDMGAMPTTRNLGFNLTITP